jgi:hypothetical protein
MRPPDERPSAPAIEHTPPQPNTRRTALIVAVIAIALVIGVVLHVTGVMGPG